MKLHEAEFQFDKYKSKPIDEMTKKEMMILINAIRVIAYNNGTIKNEQCLMNTGTIKHISKSNLLQVLKIHTQFV